MCEEWMKALEEPSEGLLKTIWTNLPTPHEIDTEDSEPAKALLSAILASIKNRLTGKPDHIPTLYVP